MAKRTVLITGCSDGGLGAALAQKFHSSGFRVFATARNPKKLNEVRALGIETLTLDVLSETSIAECVEEVRSISGSLDILVNNAGAVYFTALTDASIVESQKLFDLNVWAPLAMTKAFLPLLLKSSNPIIANHTSAASVVPLPFNGIYAASKAAIASITVALRGELSPFSVKVVDIKSGNVKSNINDNQAVPLKVASTSLYYPAREWLEAFMKGKAFEDAEIPAYMWANTVVAALSKNVPPSTIWCGGNVRLVYWATSLLPGFMVEKLTSDAIGLDKMQRKVKEYGVRKAVINAFGEDGPK